ncbi:TPA: fimbrial protein [Stenotrophomonas maltophilia]
MAAVVSLILAAGMLPCAQACPVAVPVGVLDEVYSVQYTDLPDILLASHSGAAYVALDQCTGTVDLDFAPLLTGLRYVRTINGEPAHEIAGVPGSPLVTLSMRMSSTPPPPDDPDDEWEEGVEYQAALQAGRPSSYRWSGGFGEIQFRLDVKLYSPGGPVRAVPHSALGTITTTIRQQPASQLRQHLMVGVDVQGPTCSLSDTSVTLDPVSADELQGGGSTAGAKPFDVLMNCPFAGTPVKLTLTDVNQPGNRTTGLLPAPGSTSGGVRVQLRRGGTPITVGQQWDHGVSEAGTNRIPLEARYLRTTGTLTPGELTVQGVLTADYR